MAYALQLATEALTVGAVTVGGFSVVRSLLPNSSLYTQLFVTGLGIHLSFEALGLNRWYLRNGAAALS
jgi:hypothetical protein